MPKIFINYRRDDSSGYAGRIHEALASVFGDDAVFIDIDDIKPGVDYVTRIEESIAGCDVMLVLIGTRWLDSRDASGRRRIDDRADFVRIEIQKGLARNVRIIPVLIDNAAMPGHADIPSDIGRLATLEAIALSDSRWQYDMSQLMKAVAGRAEQPIRKRRRTAAAIATSVLLVAIAGFMLWPAREVPEVSGRWVADVRYDFSASHAEVFVLRVSGGTIIGSASFLGVDRGIVDGIADGATVSFSTHTEEIAGDQTRQAQHHYRGRFDADQLWLAIQTEGGFSPHAPVDFVARRSHTLGR